MTTTERDKLKAVLPDRFEMHFDDDREGSIGETAFWDKDNEVEYSFSKLVTASGAITTLLRNEKEYGFAHGKSEVQHGVKLALGL